MSCNGVDASSRARNQLDVAELQWIPSRRRHANDGELMRDSVNPNPTWNEARSTVLPARKAVYVSKALRA